MINEIEPKNENNIQKREIIYDFIRVIACFCVIGIHCTDFLTNYTIGSPTWWAGTVIQSIVRIGLPIFTLLSGVLILNGKDEKVSKFYFKRFIKIVIPLYIYSFIYIYAYKYDYSFQAFKLTNLINILKDITKEYYCYHLWYVYMIIGIYLCAPYIKKMCKALSDKDCENLLILIFVISIIKYLLPSIGINIGITNLPHIDFPFIDWTLIFILGYLVTREVIVKKYKTIYFLGCVSFIFYFIAKRWLPNIQYLDDFSVTMMLETMAVYLFFYRNKEKICSNKIINNIIIYISEYSWEIYLIHVYVINLIRLVIIGSGINIVVDSIVLTMCVAIVSFSFVHIIHNVITINLQSLIKKIIELLSKLKMKENLNRK